MLRQAFSLRTRCNHWHSTWRFVLWFTLLFPSK